MTIWRFWFFETLFFLISVEAEARPFSRSSTFFLSPKQRVLINMVGTILVVGCVIGIFLYVRSWRKNNPRPEEPSPRKKSARDKPTSTKNFATEETSIVGEENKQPKLSPSQMPEAIVTEKTRELITSIVTSIKSAPTLPPSEQTPVETEEMEKLEVVQALADTLVSSPKIEDSDIGKFSKMSVDGSLIFEEGETIEEDPTKKKS